MIQNEQPQRRSICQVISPVSISYISGRHSINKIRLACPCGRIINLANTLNTPNWMHAHSSCRR